LNFPVFMTMEDRLAQLAVIALDSKWLCHERDARASVAKVRQI